MYEVTISIPLKIVLDGDFDEVVKESREIGEAAQAALAKSVKEANYVEVLKPRVISAVLK